MTKTTRYSIEQSDIQHWCLALYPGGQSIRLHYFTRVNELKYNTLCKTSLVASIQAVSNDVATNQTVVSTCKQDTQINQYIYFLIC